MGHVRQACTIAPVYYVSTLNSPNTFNGAGYTENSWQHVHQSKETKYIRTAKLNLLLSSEASGTSLDISIALHMYVIVISIIYMHTYSKYIENIKKVKCLPFLFNKNLLV